MSLAAPVCVAELDQCRKNIGDKEPLRVVRRKLHHVAPVLPEGPLVLCVFQMVCKPESRKMETAVRLPSITRTRQVTMQTLITNYG